MSYDIHITRRTHWTDDVAKEISLAEWQFFVSSDPDLVQDSGNGQEDFLYKPHPNGPWPLFWGNGEVLIPSPDSTMLEKAISIATILGAKVLGDDGEHYIEVGSDPVPAE